MVVEKILDFKPVQNVWPLYKKENGNLDGLPEEADTFLVLALCVIEGDKVPALLFLEYIQPEGFMACEEMGNFHGFFFGTYAELKKKYFSLG